MTDDNNNDDTTAKKLLGLLAPEATIGPLYWLRTESGLWVIELKVAWGWKLIATNADAYCEAAI